MPTLEPRNEETAEIGKFSSRTRILIWTQLASEHFGPMVKIQLCKKKIN